MSSVITSLLGNLAFPHHLVPPILTGLAIIQVFTIILVLLMYRASSSHSRTKRKNPKILSSERNLHEALDEIAAAAAESLHPRLRELGNEVEVLKKDVNSCMQRVGLVRFRAFDDVGCDLSFSVALLDGNSDGVIITSLYGRQESRVYAKPVKEGKSTYPLSPEEIEALNQAVGRNFRPR